MSKLAEQAVIETHQLMLENKIMLEALLRAVPDLSEKLKEVIKEIESDDEIPEAMKDVAETLHFVLLSRMGLLP